MSSIIPVLLRQSHGTKAHLMPTYPSPPFYVVSSVADSTHPGTVFSLVWGALLSRGPHALLLALSCFFLLRSTPSPGGSPPVPPALRSDSCRSSRFLGFLSTLCTLPCVSAPFLPFHFCPFQAPLQRAEASISFQGS